MVEWWRRVRGRDESGRPVTPVSLSVSSVYAQMGQTGARRYSFYTPELQLLSETAYSTAATPTIATDYVWFGGEPLAQISNANEVAYYHNDHLGAPLLQTSSTGTVIWRVERDPYGER